MLVVLSSRVTRGQMACQRVVGQRVLLVPGDSGLGERACHNHTYISCSGLDGPLRNFDTIPEKELRKERIDRSQACKMGSAHLGSRIFCTPDYDLGVCVCAHGCSGLERLHDQVSFCPHRWSASRTGWLQGTPLPALSGFYFLDGKSVSSLGKQTGLFGGQGYATVIVITNSCLS